MAKSSHGDKASVLDIIKDAENNNLITFSLTRNGYMLKSKVDDSKELIHKGERAYHYARRYINKLNSNLNTQTGQKSVFYPTSLRDWSARTHHIV